jgi:two-component sensor histidine kinase
MDRTSHRSLGLKLVSALTDQLRARFTLDNHDGAMATLEFRVAATGTR